MPRSTRLRVLSLVLTLGFISLAPAQTVSHPPRAAVWVNTAADDQPAQAREIADAIQTAGYTTTFLDNAALIDAKNLNADRFDLLVLPGAQSLPVDAIGPLETFLRAGRDLIALGLPAWKNPLFHYRDRWLTRSDFDQTLAAVKPERVLVDFAREDPAQWTRSANTPGSKALHARQSAEGGPALHVVIDQLSGWDTLASPPLDHPFPAGQTLTCFRARGGPRTRQLAVEWIELDGSRWIATVDLDATWRNYGLTPGEFHPWQPPPGRGGRGDHLRVENATRFTVGLAFSHTASEPGAHEYWFANLGTAANPFGDFAPPTAIDLPRLETLSPAYQAYPVTGPVELRTPHGQAIVRLFTNEPTLTGPSAILPHPMGEGRGEGVLSLANGLVNALQPRPRGVGFDQQRPWRWQPLIEARARNGDYRGAIATLLVQARAPYRGGIWAGITPSDPEFYRPPAMRQALRELATSLRRGVFLLEGGSEFFTVFEDQPCRLGARAVNFGRENQTNLTVRIAVSEHTADAIAFRREWPLNLASGAEQAVEQTWQPSRWPARGFSVTTELLTNGRVIDRLQHELHVWRPKPKPDYIEARDGGLWLDGRPWRAHGVNYMPSSGIGVTGDYFEYWLDRGAYDPEVIERDLERVKAMGLNAVSVFVYYRELKAQHLLDFLRRCDALGLRVNQSLRPGTPLEFRWNEMKELIEFFRMAQNDAIFAYDLAWEPSHFDQAHQQTHYAAPWNAWVLRRYGNADAAEKAWGVPMPRNGGELTVPPMSQLTRDGPWRRLVTDYRAFLDDFLREKYAGARQLVKSIDPNHAVSFRMQLAGDPTFDDEHLLPYDFYGLADAVDVWEPEAYGRIGDWSRVKPGEFTAAYARLCDPKKPLVWAEMGYNVWDLSRIAMHPDKVEFAGRFYRDFYRMLRESGADGVFFWLYPGGFRVNEQSDFGIINPDGTDRAITRVIREEGPRFLDAPKPPAPNFLIKIDRTGDARGLFGIYEKAEREYWQAIADGKTPGLVWEARSGVERK
ncbi:MAG: hypothetical protein ACYDH9_25365 [Limisphaerales bacterium]